MKTGYLYLRFLMKFVWGFVADASWLWMLRCNFPCYVSEWDTSGFMCLILLPEAACQMCTRNLPPSKSPPTSSSNTPPQPRSIRKDQIPTHFYFLTKRVNPLFFFICLWQCHKNHKRKKFSTSNHIKTLISRLSLRCFVIINPI